jgi:hypothetical protein
MESTGAVEHGPNELPQLPRQLNRITPHRAFLEGDEVTRTWLLANYFFKDFEAAKTATQVSSDWGCTSCMSTARR